MADFTSVDPWTTVLNRLWTLLENNVTFCAAVPSGHRIKFVRAGDQNPIKENPQNADTPEVVILMESAVDRQAFTSLVAGSDQNFQIQITTLDLRLWKADGSGMNNLRWLIYQILSNAGDTLGLDFVYSARITSSLQHYKDPVNRGTIGWVCFFTVTCKMTLPKVY